MNSLFAAISIVWHLMFYLRFVVWLYYAIFGQLYHLMHVRRRLLDFDCVVMNVLCSCV